MEKESGVKTLGLTDLGSYEMVFVGFIRGTRGFPPMLGDLEDQYFMHSESQKWMNAP